MFDAKMLSIKCGRGVTPYLRREVEGLGFKVLSEHDTGVEIEAGYRDIPKLNLYLRTALHVLYPLARFNCRGPKDLYEEVFSLPWDDMIGPSEYLSVVAVVNSSYVNNSMFAAQKVKDAIVDKIAKVCGRRPNSGPDKNNVVINLVWKDDKAWLYLDSSGNKLSDRGYRKVPHSAPVQETLAAALLAAAGYDGSVPFINPMCGSGTLAIEAALIASRRAPGLLRDNFGFMHIKGFDPEAWQLLRAQAQKSVLDKPLAPIVACDNDSKAIAAAKKNAALAGVEKLIDFQLCDFSQIPMPDGAGIVMLNPEYGLRLGDAQQLGLVYKSIGDFFKQRCAGKKGYIFTGNLDLAKQVGLRTSRKMIFFNAQVECRLLEYELYSGSKKERS